MTTTTSGSTMNTTKAGPSWPARNAKFLWSLAALVLTGGMDVVDVKTQILPLAVLAPLHIIILGLSAAGVQRETNAVAVEQVVRLVQQFLPGHTLVPLPSTTAALNLPPAAATATASPTTTSAPTGLADLMQQALDNGKAAASMPASNPSTAVLVPPPA